MLLDSCIVIDVLRRHSGALDYIRGLPSLPIVSAVTVAELYTGVRPREELLLKMTLQHASQVVDITYDIGREAGRYLQSYQKSHGTGLADALIAATANVLNIPLVTLNRRHFPMVEDIIVPY